MNLVCHLLTLLLLISNKIWKIQGKRALQANGTVGSAHIESPRFCRPCHSEGVLLRGRSSGAMEQPPAKSSASGLPLRRLELPCIIRNASDSQLCRNLPVRTTSSVGRQKRRDDECFLDWFSRQTSLESLGYNSSRQEDIFRVSSKKMKATAVVSEGHRK